MFDWRVGLRVRELTGNNEEVSDAPVGLLDLTIVDICDVDVGLRGLIEEEDRLDGFVDWDRSVGLLGRPESWETSVGERGRCLINVDGESAAIGLFGRQNDICDVGLHNDNCDTSRDIFGVIIDRPGTVSVLKLEP